MLGILVVGSASRLADCCNLNDVVFLVDDCDPGKGRSGDRPHARLMLASLLAYVDWWGVLLLIETRQAKHTTLILEDELFFGK